MMQVRTNKTARALAAIVLLTMVLVLLVPIGWAAEPVKINSLHTYPDAYKMKVVQVAGLVRNYRMIHGIDERLKLEGCIQAFSVEDETGTVDASYTTLCSMNPVMLKDGDQVTLEGHFLGTLDVKMVKKH